MAGPDSLVWAAPRLRDDKEKLNTLFHHLALIECNQTTLSVGYTNLAHDLDGENWLVEHCLENAVQEARNALKYAPSTEHEQLEQDLANSLSSFGQYHWKIGKVT